MCFRLAIDRGALCVSKARGAITGCGNERLLCVLNTVVVQVKLYSVLPPSAKTDDCGMRGCADRGERYVSDVQAAVDGSEVSKVSGVRNG